MAGNDSALLSPSFMGRLERLQLATQKPLAGRFSADHRSPRRGTSVDFADYREYHPGDDFRRIDYQMLARLDVVLLKLFEAEDDVNVRLLIDSSGSMGRSNKMRCAASAAAALGFVSLVRRDPVTLYQFPSGVGPQRFVGRSSVQAFFGALESMKPGGPTSVVAAARDLLGRGGPGGMSILISDLMTPEWERAIGRLPARGGEVVIVHVLSDEDLSVEATGDLDLVDSETGERVPVTLVPEVRAEYRRLATAWVDRVAHACRRSGAHYVQLRTSDDLESVLLRDWRTMGVVK